LQIQSVRVKSESLALGEGASLLVCNIYHHTDMICLELSTFEESATFVMQTIALQEMFVNE